MVCAACRHSRPPVEFMGQGRACRVQLHHIVKEAEARGSQAMDQNCQTFSPRAADFARAMKFLLLNKSPTRLAEHNMQASLSMGNNARYETEGLDRTGNRLSDKKPGVFRD